MLWAMMKAFWIVPPRELRVFQERRIREMVGERSCGVQVMVVGEPVRRMFPSVGVRIGRWALTTRIAR